MLNLPHVHAVNCCAHQSALRQLKNGSPNCCTDWYSTGEGFLSEVWGQNLSQWSWWGCSAYSPPFDTYPVFSVNCRLNFRESFTIVTRTSWAVVYSTYSTRWNTNVVGCSFELRGKLTVVHIGLYSTWVNRWKNFQFQVCQINLQ